MKRHKELYFYWLFPAFAIGFGAGKVKGYKIWDVSVSLGFCMFGFRIFDYTPEEYTQFILGEGKGD